MTTNEEVKQEILKLLATVQRQGVDRLVEFLSTSDYFTAPAARAYHDSEVGGLARHSFIVYNIFKDKVEYFDLKISSDSMILCSLLHDLCKVGYYVEKSELATAAQIDYLRRLMTEQDPTRVATFPFDSVGKGKASALIDCYKSGMNQANIAAILTSTEWVVEDMFPLGHGEKSVFMAQKFVNLTQEEACLIRWHMSFSEPGVHFNYPLGLAYRDALAMYPACIALFTSDFEARMMSDIRKKANQGK